MGRGRIDPGWGFVAPALVAIGAFFFVPVVASLLLSFTDFDVYAVARLDRLRFVGLGNYARLVAEPRFRTALGNTAYFVVVGGPLSVAASLGAALLLEAKVARWKGVFRTVLFVAVVTMIGYFQLFAEPYVMTQGGPANSTLSVVLLMYEEGFRWWNMGYGAAVAFVLFAIILLLTLVQLRLRAREAIP